MTSLLVGARRPIRFIAFPRTNQQPAILKRFGNCRYNEAEILTLKCRRELINYPPCLREVFCYVGGEKCPTRLRLRDFNHLVGDIIDRAYCLENIVDETFITLSTSRNILE
ncbi:hypothetical protein TNIN_472401 [Trichonephila inaurata madagascariensis]|uniref:Uncharacterized protein n=1 Tax=Trichonephila inaurata madagascariensis TaxID=2747483 RepID=A0A8X6XST2_9ARAC|nr:hypothetical protein TNIN_472401 [Trichonephila inaurata madagascariensis]